jgi:uncharacterized protein (TIGR03437 family)
MVSTNTGKWTGARGVLNSATPVQLFSTAFPAVTASVAVSIAGISNNASGAPSIESGSWVSIYGANLSATTRTWKSSDFEGNNLPLVLDGVSVKIDGKSAAVYYVSPGQLNVQAPDDNTVGPVRVEVTNMYGSATATAVLEPYAPAFFTFEDKYVAAVHTDGAYVAPVGYFASGSRSRPAQPGEPLMIYGTGFGPTAPAAPAGQMVNQPEQLADPGQLQIGVGGVLAKILYAGLVAVGEYQFNIIVPDVPDGDQPITATIGCAITQPGLLIPVQA